MPGFGAVIDGTAAFDHAGADAAAGGGVGLGVDSASHSDDQEHFSNVAEDLAEAGRTVGPDAAKPTQSAKSAESGTIRAERANIGRPPMGRGAHEAAAIKPKPAESDATRWAKLEMAGIKRKPVPLHLTDPRGTVAPRAVPPPNRALNEGIFDPRELGETIRPRSIGARIVGSAKDGLKSAGQGAKAFGGDIKNVAKRLGNGASKFADHSMASTRSMATSFRNTKFANGVGRASKATFKLVKGSLVGRASNATYELVKGSLAGRASIRTDITKKVLARYAAHRKEAQGSRGGQNRRHQSGGAE